MEIPTLKPSRRPREYDSYPADLRATVVRSFLFEGQSHRTLDHEVLGLNSEKTNGFQSMNVLHYLGLIDDFKGLFADRTEAFAIEALNSNDQDFGRILECLSLSPDLPVQELTSLKHEESLELSKSRADTSQNRIKRIAAAAVKPERLRVYSYTYRRNEDIVAEALFRANGVCEKCAKPAPFLRASDGTPFLEVHHIVPLSNDGEDRLENVLALCPNCHREEHHGKS
jgi:5-methylcytosine-specific restriction enzyme A